MSKRVEQALMTLEKFQIDATTAISTNSDAHRAFIGLSMATTRLSEALHRQAEHRKEALAVAADTIPQAGAKAIVAYAVTFAAFLDTGEGGE